MSSTFLNISTDTTLGGDSPSDMVVSSQKAIKSYIDNNSGSGSYTAGTGIDITSGVISVATPTLTNKQHNASGTSLVLGSVGTYSSDSGDAIGIARHNFTGWYALGQHAISIGTLNSPGLYSINIGGISCSQAHSIQLGYGSNSEANSFYVGTSLKNNWKMLGSDGKIPDDRINTTIARTSDIPSVANMQTTTNLVTSVSSSSTNSQYPSAKCLYDIVGDIESAINIIRGV